MHKIGKAALKQIQYPGLKKTIKFTKMETSIGVFVVYIDTGSPVLYIPSKSRDLADENNKMLTECK
jgi:hypothetical protein